MSDLQAEFVTSKGTIRINLYADQTPLTTANFVNLAQRGFYDGLSFHRVIENFMVQGGCPEGSGRGGPGYRFGDECQANLKHDAPGILSMANSGPGTNGSQFFITHEPTPWLDGNHTVFGKIVDESDLTVVNAIRQGDSIKKLTILGDTDAVLAAQADQVTKWNKVLG